LTPQKKELFKSEEKSNVDDRFFFASKGKVLVCLFTFQLVTIYFYIIFFLLYSTFFLVVGFNSETERKGVFFTRKIVRGKVAAG
jgi:hypothetical protein